MAFTVNTTLTLPDEYIVPGAVCQGQTSGSLADFGYVAAAIQTMWAHRKQSWACAAFTPAVSIAGTFYCQPSRGKLNGADSADTYQVDVWIYVRRSTAYPTANWTITVTCTESGSALTAVEINGGLTNSGALWQIGTLTIDDDQPSAFNRLVASTPSTSGTGATDRIYAFAAVPTVAESELPTMAGGYVLKGASSGYVYPLDILYTGFPESFASSHHLRHASRMAINGWERQNNCISGSLTAVGGWTGAGVGQADFQAFATQMTLFVPHRCSTIDLIHTVPVASVGTSQVAVYVNEVLTELFSAVTAGADTITIIEDLRGTVIDIRITANCPYNILGGWFRDADY
jgi:hypothetical protein